MSLNTCSAKLRTTAVRHYDIYKHRSMVFTSFLEQIDTSLKVTQRPEKYALACTACFQDPCKQIVKSPHSIRAVNRLFC